MNKELIQKTDLIDKNWKRMNIAYGEFAKMFDLTLSSMHVLNVIFNNEPVTQKQICKELFLPKQTVNSIVNDFYKLGYIEFQENLKDKRNKEISLTFNGKKYANTVLNTLRTIETNALKDIPESDIDICAKTVIHYLENLNRFIGNNKENSIKEQINAYTIE